MSRFGFDSFRLGDANRHAYEACYAVAHLASADSSPIVLVGAPGSGKTHLLCSIVDHLRSSEAATGIVYVSAKQFPPDVEALLEAPEPVDRAQHAVLLVDDLDRFDSKIDELGRLIALFIENEHAVLLSSSLPMANLPDALQVVTALIDDARIVEMGAIASPGIDPNRQLDEARADAEHAREDARGMLGRAEGLMREMQDSRSEFVQAQEEQRNQMAEIEKLESVFAGGESGRTDGELDVPTEDMESSEQIGELKRSLAGAQAERDSAKIQLQKTLDEITELREDLERTKQDASRELEAERLRADELKQDLEDSRVAFLDHVADQRAATEELTSLQSQLSEGTGVLERLMDLMGTPAEPSGTGGSEESGRKILRADFDEAEGGSPHRSSALHHVEELHAEADEFSDIEGPREDDEESDLPEDLHGYG